MITFLLLVCTHDRSGQVRKEQQRLHKPQFQNNSFNHFVLWMISFSIVFFVFFLYEIHKSTVYWIKTTKRLLALGGWHALPKKKAAL